MKKNLFSYTNDIVADRAIVFAHLTIDDGLSPRVTELILEKGHTDLDEANFWSRLCIDLDGFEDVDGEMLLSDGSYFTMTRSGLDYIWRLSGFDYAYNG